MASQQEIQTITSRAIFDNAYRLRLLQKPQAAAQELDIKLTRKEVKYIKSLDPDKLQRLATEVQNISHTEKSALMWA